MRFGSGLGTSKFSGSVLNYIKDGLKLYMPYKGSDTTKGVQFVGTGSTSFDAGSSQYISCGNDTSLQITSDLSICAWVKSSTTDFDMIVSKDDGSSNRNWHFKTTDSGYVRFQYWTSNSLANSTGNIDVTDGEWHHVAVTYEPSKSIKIYVDGELDEDDTSSIGASIDNDTVNLEIGRIGNGNYWNGSLKNCVIWNRALTSTEIQNVMYKSYAEVSGRLASNLVSWWALDATSLGSDIISGSWTVDTGVTQSLDGTLTFDTSTQFAKAGQADATSGVLYQVAYTVSNYSSGSVRPRISTWGTEVSANGTYTENILSSGTSVEFYAYTDGDNDFTVSDISVKQIQIEDLKGSNNGTIEGATIDTDLYGGDTPVKPRAIDNAPTVQADTIGSGSAVLDGSTDYISVADDSSLDITSDITISCWVKVSSFDTDYDGLVTKDDNGGIGFCLWLDKGGSTSTGTAKFSSEKYNGEIAESGSLNINTWYHITATHESGSVDESKIYIDGVLASTVSDTNSMVANSNDLQIGKQFETGNYNLNGNICQVGIWQGALSQETIQSVLEKTYEELTATEKSSLGSELVASNVASEWTDNSDSSTITNITGGVAIADDSGYSDIGHLRDGSSTTGLLSADFTLTKMYKVSFNAYHNGTGTPNVRLNNGASTEVITISDTDTQYTRYIVSTTSTSTAHIRTNNNSSGSVVYITNLSVKEVTHDLISYWALDVDGADSHGDNDGTLE